jgi:hypothetical protein
LLKSRRRGWWQVDILVVLPVIVPVVVVAVPCVGHLKYYVGEIKITQENDSRGKGLGDRFIEIGEYYMAFILTLLFRKCLIIV